MGLSKNVVNFSEGSSGALGGFFLVARRIFANKLLKEAPLEWRWLWLWMLSRARFRDGGGLKRGQLFTTVEDMRNALMVRHGGRQKKPTERTVRRIYSAFRDEGMITTERKRRGILISISKYEFYQKPSILSGINEFSGMSPDVRSESRPGVRSEDGRNRNDNEKLASKNESGCPVRIAPGRSSDVRSNLIRKNERKNEVKEKEKLKRKRKNSIPFPGDLILDDRFRDYGLKRGIPENRVQGVFDHFRSYHLAKGSRFVDWFRAWQTWCINDEKFRQERIDRESRQVGGRLTDAEIEERRRIYERNGWKFDPGKYR